MTRELVLVLWGIMLQGGLSSLVDVGSYRYGVVDLASHMPYVMIRSDRVVSDSRYRVFDTFCSYTTEHL